MNRTVVEQQAKATSLLSPIQGILQRKCACGNKTTAEEECSECAKKKSSLQRKLVIGASNDPLEQEADRIADQVMAMSANSNISRTPLSFQRFANQSTEQVDIVPASVDHVLASSGRPLESALRQDMEQRFGHDFSQVRVHSGSAAEQSARDVNAHAYTAGHNVVFGTGQFSSGTYGRRQLLAHELTHVLQQRTTQEMSVGLKKDKNINAPTNNEVGHTPNSIHAHSVIHILQRKEVSTNKGESGMTEIGGCRKVSETTCPGQRGQGTRI